MYRFVFEAVREEEERGGEMPSWEGGKEKKKAVCWERGRGMFG